MFYAVLKGYININGELQMVGYNVYKCNSEWVREVIENETLHEGEAIFGSKEAADEYCKFLETKMNN